MHNRSRACSSHRLVAYYSYKIKLTRTAKGIGFLSKSSYYPGYYATLVRNLYFRHHQFVSFVLKYDRSTRGVWRARNVKSNEAERTYQNFHPANRAATWLQSTCCLIRCMWVGNITKEVRKQVHIYHILYILASSSPTLSSRHTMFDDGLFWLQRLFTRCPHVSRKRKMGRVLPF